MSMRVEWDKLMHNISPRHDLTNNLMTSHESIVIVFENTNVVHTHSVKHRRNRILFEISFHLCI